ncbi:uncharacterized [Tachysurus ichikawai]
MESQGHVGVWSPSLRSDHGTVSTLQSALLLLGCLGSSFPVVPGLHNSVVDVIQQILTAPGTHILSI